jgi:hypothetical protein
LVLLDGVCGCLNDYTISQDGLDCVPNYIKACIEIKDTALKGTECVCLPDLLEVYDAKNKLIRCERCLNNMVLSAD